MLEEEALDLTHYIIHTGQVSLFGCVIEFDLLNGKNPKPNVIENVGKMLGGWHGLLIGTLVLGVPTV